MEILTVNHNGVKFTINKAIDNRYSVFSHSENRHITGDNLQDSVLDASIFIHHYEVERQQQEKSGQINLFDLMEA